MDLINILFAKALSNGNTDKEYVDEAIKALKGEVSADLDTLEELSKALGNDPNFFLSIKNELDKKITQEELNSVIANLVSISNYNPIDKTDSMTQPIGKDGDGKLWTAPGAVQTVNGEAPDENGNVEVQAGVQSDWNQNDETSPAFVKNRPFYTGKPVVTELIPEQTYTLSSSGSFTMYMDESGTYPYSLEVGKEYIVVYNGTTYELTSDNVDGIGVVGDIKPLVTGSQPTMPFAIAAGMGILQIIDYTGNTEVTFKISSYNTEIKQIDTKYIPWKNAVGLYPPVLINKSVESLTNEEKQKYYDLFNKGSLLLARPEGGSIWCIVTSIFYSGTVGLEMTLFDSSGRLRTYSSNGGWKTNNITKDGMTTTINDILNKRTNWLLLNKVYSSVSSGEAFDAAITWNDSTGKASIQKKKKGINGFGTDTVNSDIVCSGDKDIVLSSSTADSTKKFKITVDDTGKPTFTDINDPTNTWTPIDELPTVTSEDAGKFLRVSSAGTWVAESISNAEEASF